MCRHHKGITKGVTILDKNKQSQLQTTVSQEALMNSTHEPTLCTSGAAPTRVACTASASASTGTTPTGTASAMMSCGQNRTPTAKHRQQKERRWRAHNDDSQIKVSIRAPASCTATKTRQKSTELSYSLRGARKFGGSLKLTHACLLLFGSSNKPNEWRHNDAGVERRL